MHTCNYDSVKSRVSCLPALPHTVCFAFILFILGYSHFEISRYMRMGFYLFVFKGVLFCRFIVIIKLIFIIIIIIRTSSTPDSVLGHYPFVWQGNRSYRPYLLSGQIEFVLMA